MGESVLGRPHPALAPWVAHYAGYSLTGAAPGSHRGLPSPYLTLIATIGAPLHVAVHPDARQAAGRYEVLLGGLHTSPATVCHEGAWAGVQVAMHPLGAAAVLGVPAGVLASADLEAADVLGADARRLHERLAEAPGWAERFAALDAVLLDLAAASARRRARPAELDARAAVGRAWGLLVARQGRATVGELADVAGWGERRLRDRMLEQTGLAPRAAARVVRFDAARRAIAARPGDLAGLAAAHGYADQSHLVREWRALAGAPPTVWMADEGIVPERPSARRRGGLTMGA